MKTFGLIFLAATFCGRVMAGSSPQTAERMAVQVSYAMSYLCYLPEGYDQDSRRRWPLVIFLHGQGARGTRLADVRKEGLAAKIEHARSFPFIVVSPQCPADEWWNLPAIEAFIDETIRKYRVDPDRVYLTGLSMGGFGVWALAQRDPDRYAAIIPVAGSGEPHWAPRLAHLPTWAAHGAHDDAVPVASEQKLIDAIRAAGGSPRYTVFPSSGHNVWDEFYANDALYAWMLAQHRAQRAGLPAPK
ncbi:MAG: esterase, depolymerase family [Verrucomicrobia bacterium]|nr:esterase, depolymerase family [Verrucomicrobiota bacterium]